MVKIIVIEDNIEVFETFKSMVELYFNELSIIAHFTHAEDAYSFIKKNTFDWLLLDIELAGNLNGFDLLEMIGNTNNFKVVCFTGQQDKAIEAIRHKVFDFILKPLSIKELKGVLDRYKNDIHVVADIKSDSNVTELHNENILTINTHEKTMYLKPSEIIMITADGAYSIIDCTNKRTIRCSKNLAMLSKHLNEDTFLRISRSIIINKIHIEHLKKGGNKKSHLVMKEKKIIPLSTNIKQHVYDMMGKKTI